MLNRWGIWDGPLRMTEFVRPCTWRLKNDVQLESCELSFIWGKMRTAPREAVSQRALGDCSKVAVGESQFISFGEGEVHYHEALNLQKVFFFFLILCNLLQNEDTVYYSLFKREFKEQRHIENKLFLQMGKNTSIKKAILKCVFLWTLICASLDKNHSRHYQFSET